MMMMTIMMMIIIPFSPFFLSLLSPAFFPGSTVDKKRKLLRDFARTPTNSSNVVSRWWKIVKMCADDNTNDNKKNNDKD